MANTIMNGVAVSEGIALGTLTIYRPRTLANHSRTISDDASIEMERFHRARSQARANLGDMYRKAIRERGKVHADIITAYLTMLDDPEYIKEIERLIVRESLSAEYAVKLASDTFASSLKATGDEYMCARASDITDVGIRLAEIIGGISAQYIAMRPGTILLADTLSPRETLKLDKRKIAAILTKRGSKLSHTAILARSMNIPSMVGIDYSGDIDGLYAIVDGFEGKLIIDPDEETIALYKEKLAALLSSIEQLEHLKTLPSTTADGKYIKLLANIGSNEEADIALDNSAEGIGLLRTEFLYLDSSDYPSEESQYQSYLDVASKMPDKSVVIRTLDIGADKKASYMNLAEENNPAMGMRGIRLSLGQRDNFKTQLRAIMRANIHGNISILIPMIISVEEVWQVKELIYEVSQELESLGIAFKTCKLGIMIETPAAAFISDILAREVDFLSIGTNDLTQYMLAVDRQNSALEFICDFHHEAVLRILGLIITNAHNAGKPICICGEMAADTSFTQQLLRMGVDELSVAPGSILRVKEAIRNSYIK